MRGWDTMPFKRHKSFQRLYRTKSYPTGKLRKEPPPGDTAEEGEWCLVSSHGNVHRLPKTMIFLGREECDIEVQSDTVDKRHAVVTFDHSLRRFKIKDLSTANGTHVNKDRIPEQEYVILDEQDSLYLGNDDSITFHMERFEDPPNTEQEGETIFSPIDDELPPWANTNTVSQELQSPLAECQGCIVEQRIEHTCNENNLETESAHKDLDRSYSHDSIASFGLGCNTWPKKRYKQKKTAVHEIFGDMDEERSLHVEGLIDVQPSRVLRGTGAPMNKLPDELATVKKGTPLYGQPEWWGEEESDLNLEKLRSNGSSMERIPSKDSEKSEESRTNVSNSNKTVVNGDTKTDNNVPNNNPQAAESSPTVRSPEGITNMAFTVDFGDESKKQLEGKSIQDFMPSRLRKSFRERMEKNSEKSSSSKLTAKDKTTPEKSTATTSKTTGRAFSEGRDISPTRQHKIDELWSTSNSSTPDSVTSKRHKMLNKSTSSKSVDDEKHDLIMKASKTSAVKRRTPLSASNSKPKSVIRARKAVSQEVLATCTPHTGDNTSYLIDKMFQNNSTGSVDSLRTKDTINSATEYEMYHEAVKFDTERSARTNSQDMNSFSAKVDKEKSDKKVRSKEVPVTILKKSIDDSSPETEEDKVSEAGTYTIEEEKDSKEEDEARKNIDKVFGVDRISMTGSEYLSDDLKQNGAKPDKQGELTLNLQNLNLELEEIERLEKLRARPPMADSMEAELGSAESREYMENNDNPNVPLDAPKWVTQWAALTNQKGPSKSDMDLSSPGSSVSDESRSSGKANGISRKRPGTGRKLPTIPPGAPSPASSDKSATKESPMLSGRSDLTVNGTGYQASQQRAINGSSQNTARYEDDVDLESMTLTQRSNELDSARDFDTYKPRGSNASVASLDTEVLLKDTHTVMTAMEQRMGSKPRIGNQHGPSDQFSKLHHDGSFSDFNYQSSKDVNESLVLDDSVDFESDTSSCVALVNGDEDFVKPSLYKSPREALGKGKLKLTESLPSKPSLKLSGAKSRTISSEKERKRSTEESKAVSDIFSDINGTTARTDDLDTSDVGQFNRTGSKGKGQMSMTRPNRAFALRRARADGDEPDTSRSSASSVSTASTGFKTPRGGSLTNLSKSNSSTPQKPRRPMSGVLADRQAPDSQRSQVSLGAQIVQKSRDNLNSSLNRADGGRHSLRMARSMTIPVQPQQNTPTKSRRNEGSSSSTLQHSKSLRVTGVSARERSSSVSKPGGRTNSPKSAERNAWKRRKEYDPRRAVAEAKSKPKQKDTKTRRSDGMEGFNKARGVTRSASFTNARDLKLSSYQCDSTSSAEDYSRRSSGASDVFEEPKRGFVPYSVRSLMSSKVSTSSADDDDMDRSARSSSAQSSTSYDTLIVSSIYQLSLKLKTQTDKTMEKLRDTEVIENGLESPLDELENQSAVSEIPAYKSANQELAGVLKNLRKLEQHIKVINKVLFPDYDGSPDTSKEKHEYLQEIERIKNELAGFQPIETPRDDIWKQTETASVESDCEELGHAEYY